MIPHITPATSLEELRTLSLLLKGLGEVTSLKPIRLKLTTDNEIIEDDFYLFLILNGKHAQVSYLSNTADLSDGFMDILLLKSCPHIELAGLILGAKQRILQ